MVQLFNRKEYDKNKRDIIKSLGRCTNHPKNICLPGKKTCEECSSNNKKRRNDIFLLGKCANHPSEDVLKGFKRCSKCRELNQSSKIKVMICGARRTSTRDKVPFAIVEQDIINILPSDNICPVFKRSFVYGNKRLTMSLDKIIPEKGYVNGNVQIISKLANVMKSNATWEELILFRNWINKLEKERK